MTKEEFIGKVKAMFNSIADKDKGCGIVLLFDTGDMELAALRGGDAFKTAAMVAAFIQDNPDIERGVKATMTLFDALRKNRAVNSGPVVNTTNKSVS